jgi:CII-binding regulator of phage lambda lysogenization HflD
VGPRTVIYVTGGTLELEQGNKFIIIVGLSYSNTISCIKNEIIVKGKDDSLIQTQM